MNLKRVFVWFVVGSLFVICANGQTVRDPKDNFRDAGTPKSIKVSVPETRNSEGRRTMGKVLLVP